MPNKTVPRNFGEISDRTQGRSLRLFEQALQQLLILIGIATISFRRSAVTSAPRWQPHAQHTKPRPALFRKLRRAHSG